jgi:hypothetical protein
MKRQILIVTNLQLERDELLDLIDLIIDRRCSIEPWDMNCGGIRAGLKPRRVGWDLSLVPVLS